MSLPSTAAQVIISIIPIVGIFMGCVVAFFYLLWAHRERTLLIERGLYQPTRLDLEVFSLLAGLLLGCTGLVLSLILVFLQGLSYGLLGGLIPLSIGIGLLVFYNLSRAGRGK